jgi:hypothetical protein
MDRKLKRDAKNARHKQNEIDRLWNIGNPRIRKRAAKLRLQEMMDKDRKFWTKQGAE